MLRKFKRICVYPKNSYVISLAKNLKLQEVFMQLGVNIQNAINSADDKFVYKKYGYNLDPADETQRLYFSQSHGAVGCLLSHVEIWKRAALNSDGWTLCLEDDCSVKDLKSFLSLKPKFKIYNNTPQLIQLNKRTTKDKLPFNFEGTESYLINQKAAQSLIYLLNDSSFLNHAIREYSLFDACGPNSNLISIENILKKDSQYKFDKPNAIRYAADKFIGLCSLPECPQEHRLNIELFPRIGLSKESLKSNVINKNRTPYWHMSSEEYFNFKNSSDYCWWSNR
jgi:GR25 family glycosyltransferase involved in LPS biosynthesis